MPRYPVGDVPTLETPVRLPGGSRDSCARCSVVASRGGWDDTEGGVGVREPRRPLTPSLTGAAALELPTDDGDDSG